MRLWLVCCVLLFLAAQGYDWMHHLPWLAEFALPLPLAIAAGTGLALISNYTAGSSLPSSNGAIAPKVAEPTVPVSPQETAQSPQAPARTPASVQSSGTSSISFEIARRRRSS